MPNPKPRPKPVVVPEFCKACGRCVEACNKGSLTMGTTINPATGLPYVILEAESCNGCGLCFTACPEPYGLLPETADFQLEDPAHLFGPRRAPAPAPEAIPDELVPLPPTEPLIVRGTYASAIGAMLAGCRHFFGYPITPSTEGAELMAKLLPMLDGLFVQAVSEVATINMMYGCGAAGRRSLTFTSSPGFSLMLEGVSYMIGADVPGVIVNVMRGGPGLGNIGPEQADIKLACRGLGHGNTHGVVLAPSTPQEMLDLTMLAFDLSFKYRNPAIVLCDGFLGQMTGKVVLPKTMLRAGVPAWAVWGDRAHRGNLICSIDLAEEDLSIRNERLNEKYARIQAEEQRVDRYHCEDAEIVLVACNTPSRMAKGAVSELRARGVKAGLFRPLTLWPFPIDALRPLLATAKRLLVVEASSGQLEDEMRLAISHSGVAHVPPIEHVRTMGGLLPQQPEIVERVLALKRRPALAGVAPSEVAS